MASASPQTMIYTVDLGDGRIADIEGPPDATPDQLQAFLGAVPMTPDGRMIVDVYGDLPPTKPPPERTLGERLHMGVGDVAQGAGDVLGIVGNPVNSLLNMTGVPKALIGEDLSTDLGATARDLTGAPDPATDEERLISAISRGGTGAMTGAGLASGAKALPGMAGYVAEQIAANPVKDFIAGLTGGAGAEVGNRVGGLPGAIVGGLVGVGAGLSAVRIGERAAEHFPRAAMVDEAGNLTEDGLEISHRVGADPGVVREAYIRKGRGPTPPTSRIDRPNADIPVDQRTQRLVAGIEERVPTQTGGRFPPATGDVFADAGEEGIQLTRGQAEQNFTVQNDENSLRVVATREGEQARQFFAQQAEQIRTAAARFRSAFGEDAGDAAGRGEQLKESISDLRDAGAEGVRTLYREAEALGGGGLRLEVDGIREAAVDVLIDEAVPETVKRAVSQELARYGIIGQADAINEAGLTRVQLDDGSSITFRGPVKELSASNAEDLRRAINRLYDPTKPNLSGQSIKPAIDDALEAALERGATTEEGAIGNAYRAARDAHRTQKQTFSAKDIIDSLIANKKGTNTPVVLPEKAIALTIGQGPKAVSNLRTVKNLLQSSPTRSARQGWQAIQQQALADIFDGAVQRNVNGGDLVENISGAKLRTMIFDRYGADKLRAILEPEEFSQLMKLQRIIGTATIPLSGTTNPSGTFTKLVNFLGQGALKFTGGFGDAAVALAGKARDLATTRKTLRGITSYDGRRATGERFDRQAQEFIRDYIASGKSGKLVPPTINLSATQGGSE